MLFRKLRLELTTARRMTPLTEIRAERAAGDRQPTLSPKGLCSCVCPTKHLQPLFGGRSGRPDDFSQDLKGILV